MENLNESTTKIRPSRIGVDAREIFGQPAGKGKYLAMILLEWFREPWSDTEFFLYVDKSDELPSELREVAEASRSNYKVRQVEGQLWHRATARELRRDNVDVYYASLSYQSAFWNSVPTVTVVHDLVTLACPNVVHNRKSAILDRIFLRRGIRKSTALMAVSEATSADVRRFFPETVSRPITVAHNAASFLAESPSPRSNRDKNILFVGTLEPRKNILGLLKAYALLPSNLKDEYPLILAGKIGWGDEPYLQTIEQLGLQKNVVVKGYVSSEELIHLYKTSTLLAYPSFYEGFGIPIVEAMACGTPVVTSNTSSMPEVLGDGGLSCDPNNIGEIASNMVKVLTDENLWNEFQKRGIQQSRKFSWRDTARKTKKVLIGASNGKA